MARPFLAPVYLYLGFLLQAVAIGLILLRLRSNWLGRSGAVFAVVLFFYHGLTEVMQAVFPNENAFRLMTNDATVDMTVFMSGCAILLYAGVYLVALGKDPAIPSSREALRPLWDARVPIFAMALLTALLRITGLASGDLAGAETSTGYWQTGLTIEFGDFALVLAVLALSYRYRGQTALTLLTGVLALVAAVAGNSRLIMLIAVLMTLGASARYGGRIAASRLVALGALGLVLMVAISAARQAVGRESLKGGGKGRIEGLASGLSNTQGNDAAKAGVLSDFVYRFDGNSFSAMVRDEYRRGMVPMGGYPLAASTLLVVPSFVYPAKLNVDPLLLNEKFLDVLYFSLPYGDYNVMGIGQMYAMYDTAGVMAMAVIGALLFGLSDRWLHGQASLHAALISLGLLRCATYYEWGIAIYPATIRALLGLYAILAGWLVLRRGWARLRRAGMPPSGASTEASNLPVLS